jgi:hypothetical protein
LEIGGIHLEGTTTNANAMPNYFISPCKKSHHGPAHHPVRNLIMVNRNFKYKKKKPNTN